MKFKIKPLSVSLAALIIITLFVFGALKGQSYLQVKGLMSEASVLADKGMYEGAVDKLEVAEQKWTTENIRKEIRRDSEQYKALAESSNNFNQAKLEYNFKNYEKAIEYFKKVLKSDVNYKSAQNWIVLSEERLAEGEKKETPKRSVAGVNTSEVSNPTQLIPTLVRPDDKPKMEAILNFLKKILELNIPLPALTYSIQETWDYYNCNIDKWGKQYLPNGEYNPNFILDPSKQTQLYQECVNARDSSIASYAAQIEHIKGQIRSIDNQIQGIIATCATNQCSDFYREAITSSEAQGYIMR